MSKEERLFALKDRALALEREAFGWEATVIENEAILADFPDDETSTGVVSDAKRNLHICIARLEAIYQLIELMDLVQ